jgi:hypothetical protein
MTFRFRLSVLALALAVHTSVQADPLAELAAFSGIKGVNLDELAKGTVKTGHLPMGSPRGLGVESCYVVRKPLAKTVELHSQDSPSDAKVFVHGDLPAHPTAGDFSKLGSALGNSAAKSFVADTLKLAGGGTKLQVSNAEAKSAPTDSAGVPAFWSNVLAQRAQAFASGGTGKLPPYETGGETAQASAEIAQLLKESGKVRAQFSGLIGSTALGGGKGSLTPSLSWEMFDEDGHAAVTLGASYVKQSAGGAQMAEVQYYASSGFYALITLYQMWPVNVGGQDCTLVWRGDLISSASVKASERMGAGSVMMKETKKSIQSLLGDAR